MKRVIAFALLLAAACGPIPRDPDGTLDRVEASGEIRVGMIADPAEAGAGDEAAAFLARIERRTGSRARIERGDAATLLARLESGDLDLVLGGFLMDSPWATRVTFSTPLAIRELPVGEHHFLAAMANGENAWIGLVENEAYAMRAPGA